MRPRILSRGRSATLLAALILISSTMGAREVLSRGKKPASGKFHRGMAVGLYSEGKKHGTYDRALEEVREIGVTHVSFVVQWTMDSVRDLDIRPVKGDTVPDERLTKVVEKARSIGLEVFLFPIIHVAHRKPLEWRGVIRPTDSHRWWAEYETFILHYAALAQRTRIKLLSVGSELVSLEKESARWETLIRRVRSIYDGELIYSANWDHYRPVTFWHLVDYVGMTGYHGLTKSRTPTLDQLKAGWEKVKIDVVAFQAMVGKPVIFTEIGYPSQDGANMHPWDYTTKDPIDLEEQYLCYRAFYEVWRDAKSLGGVYFWNWWGEGGPKDGWYTPRGKPAADVVRAWFRGTPL